VASRQDFVENKGKVIDSYHLRDGDTGSVEVQVALLTERIQYLSTHLERHKKDYASRVGLLTMVNGRRKLLEYVRRYHKARYESLIGRLGLRK